MNVIGWLYVCYKIWKINKKIGILPPNIKKMKRIGGKRGEKKRIVGGCEWGGGGKVP
jgi:hypothetical protein